MPNLINKMIVRELSQAFGSTDGMVIVSMAGLSVEQTEDLRNSLAEHGLRLRMVRNRLARLALKERGIEPPEDMLLGNIACAWGSSEEAVTAAKVLHNSTARKEGKVVLKGGLFEGALLGPREAVALAALPGRSELRATMLGLLNAPARNLVGLLHAPGSSLVRVVDARSKEAEAAPPEPAA
jgi:large subunit ribosomal protein L10